MTYPVSACVFIRNCFDGAFCLFESMASILPFVSEFIVMDLGSNDGTLELLLDIEKENDKVKIIGKEWPEIDAGVFATLANELIDICQYDNVLYYQADEIFHQDLLKRMESEFEQGHFDLSFWRIQYRDNFQRVKWFPHFVHRVGKKDRFHFVGDGMNSDRFMDAKLCSVYDGGYFLRWGDMGQDGIKPFVNDMITDVSLVGGFRDNIIERRLLHAPFWHEEPHIEGVPGTEWAEKAIQNEDWTKPESPYNLPHILKWHIGRVRYEVRQSLLDALKADDTRGLLGL